MLIGHFSSWKSETEEVQLALIKLSEETLIKDNQLFKKLRANTFHMCVPVFASPWFHKPIKKLATEELARPLIGSKRTTSVKNFA